jgi:hypothetical protein
MAGNTLLQSMATTGRSWSSDQASAACFGPESYASPSVWDDHFHRLNLAEELLALGREYYALDGTIFWGYVSDRTIEPAPGKPWLPDRTLIQ